MSNEEDEDDGDNGILILDWSVLTSDEINERLDWMRKSLLPGQDWGYCQEYMTCVLKTLEASTMYKLTWFESGRQKYIDKPMMLKNAQETHMTIGETNDVWT